MSSTLFDILRENLPGIIRDLMYCSSCKTYREVSNIVYSYYCPCQSGTCDCLYNVIVKSVCVTCNFNIFALAKEVDDSGECIRSAIIGTPKIGDYLVNVRFQ